MKITGSLQAVRQVITVDWKNHSQEQAKRHLINTARYGIQGILNDQTVVVGSRPGVTVYANHPGNANLESVVLPGPIVALFDHRAAIAKMAVLELRAASPVVSGQYRDSHIILLNGAPVATLPPTLKASDEIVIVNPLPYARRVEIGKTTAGRDFVIQVPNRIYERTAKQKLIPRFRNVADIRFGYMPLTGAHTVKGKLPSHYAIGEGRRRKRQLRAGTSVDAPAIFIMPYQEHVA